jgi:drug/metabolite transporter (DMT)-like permease
MVLNMTSAELGVDTSPATPTGTTPPARPTTRAILPITALLLTTAVWGSTFPLLKGVIDRVPVPDFLAVRFAIATIAVAALRPTAVLRLSAAQRRRGIALGVAYGLGQALQTIGLQHTSAAVSGFVTGMYVVLTPLLGAALLRTRTPWHLWIAVGLATAGLGTLSLHGLAVGPGELLTLLSAAMYALHILGLGAWSTDGDTYGLTVVQLGTVTVICTLGALPGGLTVPDRTSDWGVLVYMAVAAGAVAMMLQTWAQSRLSAARTAIILTMEPVFAGVFAVLIGGELLGPRIVIGGALVLTAMILVEAVRPAEPAR